MVVLVGVVLEFVLWFAIMFVLARIVAEWVQMFARAFVPTGMMLVLLEVVYTITDPPLRLLRRFVPPLRLGGQSIDLSILIVLLILYLFQILNRNVLLFG